MGGGEQSFKNLEITLMKKTLLMINSYCTANLCEPSAFIKDGDLMAVP